MKAIAGVFGNPIEQSKSPIIHQHFADQFGISLDYSKQYSEVPKFESDLNAFFSQANVIGANVTLPFKERAFAWVDDLTTQAKRAGAVNTIIHNLKENTFTGANSDGLGLLADFAFHDVDLTGKSILLVGAGGAAKGALPAILEAGVSSVAIYNRTHNRADSLVTLSKAYANCDVSVFIEQTSCFDIIINATSLSLSAQLPNIPNTVFGAHTIVYDMVYSDEATVFMKWAQQQGCGKSIDGLGMLVEQAAVSFEYWFGQKPNTGDIRKQLRKS